MDNRNMTLTRTLTMTLLGSAALLAVTVAMTPAYACGGSCHSAGAQNALGGNAPTSSFRPMPRPKYGPGSGVSDGAVNRMDPSGKRRFYSSTGYGHGVHPLDCYCNDAPLGSPGNTGYSSYHDT